MKKKRAIMVALSTAVIAPALPADSLAQIIISCPVSFRVGKIAKCSSNGKVTIDPDGNLKSTVSCAHIIDTPQPGVCTVETGGVPTTKNVRVDFKKSSVTITRGGDSFLLDRLRMSYTGAPTPAASITLTPSEVKSGGVTIKVGGRISPIANSTLGQYTGNIEIRANPL